MNSLENQYHTHRFAIRGISVFHVRFTVEFPNQVWWSCNVDEGKLFAYRTRHNTAKTILAKRKRGIHWGTGATLQVLKYETVLTRQILLGLWLWCWDFRSLNWDLFFMQIDKDGCGETKSCYSEPESCKSSNDCQYLVTIKPVGDYVEFELSSKNQWGSIGFNSEKNKMVRHCTRSDTDINARKVSSPSSWLVIPQVTPSTVT